MAGVVPGPRGRRQEVGLAVEKEVMELPRDLEESRQEMEREVGARWRKEDQSVGPESADVAPDLLARRLGVGREVGQEVGQEVVVPRRLVGTLLEMAEQ